VEAQKEDILPHLMESLLTLKDIDQNNPSQDRTKENEARVDGTGDDKMNLDPQGVLHTELGHFSVVENTEENLPFYPEVFDASMQLQGIDSPTEVQGSSSKNTEAMPSALGASSLSHTKLIPVIDVPAGNIAMPASAPSFQGSEVSLSLGGSVKDAAENRAYSSSRA
ncbi:hypothetical protein KI387_041856, partial [Taxus chinensis]